LDANCQPATPGLFSTMIGQPTEDSDCLPNSYD